MIDSEKEDVWWYCDPNDKRFSHDVVESMKEMGDGAYTYALEQMIRYQEKNDVDGVELWKNVLNILDRKNNHG